MKLRLSELASIAEIIGALAVIISLVYVGVQVNDSAGAVRAASANDANMALQSWYQQIGSDQQTSEHFYEALTGQKALSDQEEFQFLILQSRLANSLSKRICSRCQKPVARPGRIWPDILSMLARVFTPRIRQRDSY